MKTYNSSDEKYIVLFYNSSSMKKRFFLLALLSSLALSGCDVLDKFFDEDLPSQKEDDNKEGDVSPSQEEQKEEPQEPSEEEPVTPITPGEEEPVTPVTPPEEEPVTPVTPPEEDPETPVTPVTPPSEQEESQEVKEYYKNISATATGNNLKTQLFNLIKNHTKYDYDNLEIAMRTTDRNWEKSPDPNDQNPYMCLLYTVNNDTKASKWNTYHGSGGISDYNSAHWNKEHIWAKSNGFPSEGSDAYCDLHHLRASDTKNNGSRSSFAFNNNSGSYVKDFNGDNSGKLASSNPKVYEPIDRDKGDVARALFYMATRYMASGQGSPTALSLTNGTDASGGKWGYLSTLLAWHTQDPPDAFEINRNELVQSFQHNRNPYIDHPEWAQKVFG